MYIEADNMKSVQSVLFNLNSKKTTPRNSIIDFFALKIERSKKIIAIRISHYKDSDLFYIKSVFNDIENRKGIVSARKYFWWQTKTKVIHR